MGSFILEMELGNNEDKGDDLSMEYKKNVKEVEKKEVSATVESNSSMSRVSHPVLLPFVTSVHLYLHS